MNWRRGLAALLILLGLIGPAEAASRFWVGGTGTWNTSSTANWSATSGGAPGASAPTSADAVTFNSSSGTGTVTMSGSVTIASLNMVNSSALTLGGAGGRTVNGSVTFGSSVTYGGTAPLTINNSGSMTFISNGKCWAGNVTFSGSGAATIQDDFCVNSTRSLTISGSGSVTTGGGVTSLNAGTFTISSGTFDATSMSGVSAAINLTGTGTVLSIAGGATYTAPTNTKITSAANTAVTVAGGGKALGILWFSRGVSTATNTITGANSYTGIKDDGTRAHTLVFPASTTQTLSSGTFNVNGTASQLISLRSSSPGTQWTISDASGSNSVDYLDIQDSAATGGATFTAGTNSINSGNNTGWVFGGTGIVSAFTLPPP